MTESQYAIGTAERYGEEIEKRIGMDHPIKHKQDLAKKIEVSSVLISRIIHVHRKKWNQKLYYSRKTAEKINRELGIDDIYTPAELPHTYRNDDRKRIPSLARIAFANILRRARDEKGLTGLEIAGLTGLSYSKVSNALKGTSCTMETAEILCPVLGVSRSKIPRSISGAWMNARILEALGRLGIETDEELIVTLEGTLERDRGYVALALQRKLDIDRLAGLLAAERRTTSALRAEINGLKGFGKTPDPEKSNKVSADPPPDG